MSITLALSKTLPKLSEDLFKPSDMYCQMLILVPMFHRQTSAGQNVMVNLCTAC